MSKWSPARDVVIADLLCCHSKLELNEITFKFSVPLSLKEVDKQIAKSTDPFMNKSINELSN